MHTDVQIRIWNFTTTPGQIHDTLRLQIHHGAQVPNEVKKWLPNGCPTPGCRHRYTTTGKRLQDHIKQCSITHTKTQTQQRTTDSEWEQIGNNVATRGRKTKQNAQPPAQNVDTATIDAEWEQIGNDAIIQGRKHKQNSPPPEPNVDTVASDDTQVELQPRQTLNISPPRCPTTNWTLDGIQKRKTDEAEWSHLEDNSTWTQVISKTQKRRLANKPAKTSPPPN